jgi:formate hydrogenlyase subunit 3/multisubunit Na+/H+ antiporter MnhD subunit
VTVTLAVVVPMLLAAAVAVGGRPAALAWRVLPLAPTLLVLPLVTREQVAWSWPLVGLEFGVDALTAPFALLTAIAWSLAGLFAQATIAARERPFWLGWTLSLVGMTAVLLAQTLTSFYLGYVVLSLSAYLMVVHARHEAARRAGRIYLIMALAGEAAILSGVLLIAGVHATVDVPLWALVAPGHVAVGPVATVLLLLGFAVKLGIIPLHVWLPLAHPIAPVPASAILSGVIVKAGLLGWLRLAQPGAEAASIAPLLLAAGFATAFGGVLLGLTQGKLKTVLAYSTVSQMGLVLVGFSGLYLAPAEASRLLPMLGLLALHHGLSKASLFLACGCAPGASRWRMVLVALPALSLAAAPLTTGYLAKYWLKSGLGSAGAATGLDLALSLTSAATALLMWRVWRLARAQREGGEAAQAPWLVLTAASLTVPWAWAAANDLFVAPSPGGTWTAVWPLLLAVALAVAGAALRRPGLTLPEGDVVVLAERALARPAGGRPPPARRRRRGRGRAPAADAVVDRIEDQFREVPVAGLAMLVVGALLWAVLWLW